MGDLAVQEQYVADFRQALSVDSAGITGATPEVIAAICNSKWNEAGDGYRLASEAKSRAALSILEFGYCLTKAKSELPYGTFSDWVKETQDCKPRYAQLAMKAWTLGAELFAEKKKQEALPGGEDISALVQDVMHPNKETSTPVEQKRSIAALLAEAEQNGELDNEEKQSIITLLQGGLADADSEETENGDSNEVDSGTTAGDAGSDAAQEAQEESDTPSGSSAGGRSAGSEAGIIDVDPHGQPIPEHLLEILGEGRDEIVGVINQVRSIFSGCNKLAKGNPELYAYFRPNPFRAAYKTLLREMEQWVPEAVCAYCAGDESQNCIACGGHGFANAMKWKASAEELKPKVVSKKKTAKKKVSKKKVVKKKRSRLK